MNHQSTGSTRALRGVMHHARAGKLVEATEVLRQVEPYIFKYDIKLAVGLAYLAGVAQGKHQERQKKHERNVDKLIAKSDKQVTPAMRKGLIVIEKMRSRGATLEQIERFVGISRQNAP